MRKPRHETKKALRDAIAASGMNQTQWCIANGVSPSAVSDCLRGAGMSSTRENTIRDVLGMEEIVVEYAVVSYEPDHQTVVVKEHPKTTPYKSRQIRVTKAEADAIDRFVSSAGYKSFSEFLRTQFADENGSVESYFSRSA